MTGKTMSDWENLLTQKGFNEDALKLKTSKAEDIDRLRKSGLPQFDWFELHYQAFSKKNIALVTWMNSYLSQGQGFCIRAIPTEEGFRKGYTRKHKFGYLSFQGCADFLSKEASGERSLWNVIISNWERQEFGGVIISGDRYVTGEIAKDLTKLTHGEEQPLAGFVLDRGGLGHMENKTGWFTEKDEKAKAILLKTFRQHIKRGGDSFNPFLMQGYFEFVITKKNEEVNFLDYKVNKAYLA